MEVAGGLPRDLDGPPRDLDGPPRDSPSHDVIDDNGDWCEQHGDDGDGWGDDGDDGTAQIRVISSVDADIQKVHNRLQLELLEINNTPNFCAHLEDPNGQYIFNVGWRIPDGLFSDIQRRVIGLISPYIVARFTFPRFLYWKEPPIIEYVAQCAEDPLLHRPQYRNPQQFTLGWAIRRRILQTWCKPFLISEVKSSDTDVNANAKIDYKDVEYLMEGLQCSFHRAVQLLKAHHNSVSDAMLDTKFKMSPVNVTNVYLLIFESLINYIQASHLTCLLCDAPLESPGIKPSMCDRTMCGYMMGLVGNVNIEAELVHGHQVLDLYVTFFISAVRSNMLHFIQLDKKETDLSAEEMCTILCDHCPSMDELRNMVLQDPGINISVYLTKLHPQLYGILRWLLMSNRAFIKPLDPEERFADMVTPYQFILLTDTPEKQEEFKMLKAAEQTNFYAFHGSNTSKWYSILRTGLKNLSKTKYMSTGNAYGDGVYLGGTSTISASYTTTCSGGWRKSMFGEHARCMALCEVIGTRETYEKANGIYVVPEDARISTRYLFVYNQKDHIPNYDSKKFKQ